MKDAKLSIIIMVAMAVLIAVFVIWQHLSSHRQLQDDLRDLPYDEVQRLWGL